MGKKLWIVRKYMIHLRYTAYHTQPAIGFNTFEQPVKIEGNVNGGLGMIGGVSQVDHVLSYDP